MRERTSLVGMRFGRLTVISEAASPYISPGGQRQQKVVCQCDCGNKVVVNRYTLTRSNNPVRSCGCIRRGEDLTGQRFGSLTVRKEAPPHRTRGGKMVRSWECECACGKRKTVLQGDLLSGKTRSCGCGRSGRLPA